MTKEEKIKEAWGKAYDEVKHLLTENGYIWSVDLAHICLDLSLYNLDLNYNDTGCRPKSLKGIENNNGWIKIENEEDLPKEDCNVFILHKTYGIITDKYKSVKKDFHYNYKKNITHYQPIEKPKPPIY